MNSNNFYSWYKDRFGNGASVADYLSPEISSTASFIGVDWDTVKNDVSYSASETCKINTKSTNLLKGFRDSVGIYVSLETDNNNVEYPLITFKNKGGNGDTEVFSGIKHLWQLFKEEKKLTTQSQKEKWKNEQAERERKVARKQEAAKRKQAEEEKRRAANVDKELQHFDQLPSAADFVYTNKKFIGSILNHVDVRLGEDKHGKYMAFKLFNIDGKPEGVQRIYEKKITKPDGSQTNKDFTWGMKKSGSHMIIGDISKADFIYVAEGFATGASVFLAMKSIAVNIAVIVAMDAGNMITVVNAYKKKKSYLDLILAVDNDMWKQKQGKGNTGLLVAMELLSQFDDIKAYAPNFKKVDPSYQPTDWNDLHVRAGLKEVANQLKGNSARVKCEGDIFEKQLKRINYVNQKQLMNEALSCVSVGMQVGMPKYSMIDVLVVIKKTTENAGLSTDYLDMGKLRQKAEKIHFAQMKEAQSLRSFSSRITCKELRPDHIEYHRYNQTVIDEKIMTDTKNMKGIVIVRSGKGSRKTNLLQKMVLWSGKQSAIGAHRVSLIGGIVDVMNTKIGDNNISPSEQMLKSLMVGEDVINYKEPSINGIAQNINKLAFCINSILKPCFQPLLDNLDTACFDEAAQELRHVTAGGAIKYPAAVFNKWLDVMTTTKEKIVLADADANDTLVEFCELALARRNERLAQEMGEDFIPEKIHIIETTINHSDMSILYTNGDTAFQKVLDDVGAGFRVLVANDSANDGEKLFNKLQTLYPNKKGLFISLDTKETPEVDAFTDSPNTESLKYDYVIYSPSISSGVSIENGHFQKHYGIFCGTVTPSDALQMIHRDRKAKEFILGLSTMHSSREENSNALWLGMILANDNQLNVNFNKEDGTIELKTNNLQFDRFRLELQAQENKAKNNFASFLLYNLIADGYQVKALDSTELEAEKGKMAKEEARDALKIIETELHLNQPTPTDEEFDDLTNNAHRKSLSKEEKAQVVRWEIENCLMMKVTEDSLKEYKNGLKGKVRLFELLNMSPAEAKKFDDDEIQNGVHPSKRHYLAKQRLALREFFEIAGFGWLTGDGRATEETLTEAINYLTDGDKLHLFNNWFDFGGYINPFSRQLNYVNKSKAIMEALGLKLDTIQLGRHTSESAKRQRYDINNDAWTKMVTIHHARKAAHTTSMKVDKLDGALIHACSDIYIETESKMDQVKTSNTKHYSLFAMIKKTIEALKIPVLLAPKIITTLTKANNFTSDMSEAKITAEVNRIYQQSKGKKTAFSW